MMANKDKTARPCRRSQAWRRARWRDHVEAQPHSGLCVVDYCQQHGLRRESFYRWRRTFSTEAAREEISKVAETRDGTPAPPIFAEVKVSAVDSPAEDSGVEVVLSGERRLVLRPGFDTETLQRAVATLESLLC